MLQSQGNEISIPHANVYLMKQYKFLHVLKSVQCTHKRRSVNDYKKLFFIVE